MHDSREDLTNENPANANPGSGIRLDLSAEDAETLLKLREAGLIDLDGLETGEPDPRLTEWTYDEFLQHMAVVQKLKVKTEQGRDSTALNRVRYVKFLETHDIVPLELRPPDEASWLDHVQYRMEEEGVAGTALNQYRKALKSLLKFLDVPMWESLNETFDEIPPHWTLPDNETVRRFWMEDLHEDPYLAATYAHIFHFGFNVGVRPPSEIVALDVDDVDFQTRNLVVTQVKKGGEPLPRDNLSPFIITSLRNKSLRNYLEHWRPKVATGESDAFFLNSEGRRFNVHSLGTKLSKLGKKVWPSFTPYTMRRWFATEFLIANDFNIYATSEKLGDKAATVERHYIDKARARAAMDDQFRMKQIRGGSR